MFSIPGHPKISIVTPSFNQGEFIERTFDSVLDQDYENFEYIVVDGGSTDETVEILRRYGPRLTHWVSEPDRGQAHAVNKGFDASSGVIVGWLNSDDQYFSPQVLQHVTQFFRRNPHVDIVFGDNVYVDESDRLLFLRRSVPFFSLRLLSYWNFIHQPTVFFRSWVVREHRLDENLDFAMDYEFWLRLANAGVRFGYLKKLLAASRWHTACKTQSNRDKALRELKRINSQYSSRFRWPNVGLTDAVMYSLQRVASLPSLGFLAVQGEFSHFAPESWAKVLKHHLFGAKLGT